MSFSNLLVSFAQLIVSLTSAQANSLLNAQHAVHPSYYNLIILALWILTLVTRSSKTKIRLLVHLEALSIVESTSSTELMLQAQ